MLGGRIKGKKKINSIWKKTCRNDLISAIMLVMSVCCRVNMRQGKKIVTENVRRGIVLARAEFHKEFVADSQLLRPRWRCTFLLIDWSDLDAGTVGKSFGGRLLHVLMILLGKECFRKLDALGARSWSIWYSRDWWCCDIVRGSRVGSWWRGKMVRTARIRPIHQFLEKCSIRHDGQPNSEEY